MKITIIAINNFEKNTSQEIFNEYKKRLRYKLDLKELTPKLSKSLSDTQIKQEEGKAILKNLDKNSFIIALDEKGKEVTSKDFSALFEKIMLDGNSHIRSSFTAHERRPPCVAYSPTSVIASPTQVGRGNL